MKKAITIFSILFLLIFISSREIQTFILSIISGNNYPVLYERVSMFHLLGQHLLLSGASGLIAIILGCAIGIGAAKSNTDEIKKIVLKAAGLAQSFPPAAVIALAVPLAGYGFLPVFWALLLYGILPILGNTIKGFNSIEQNVLFAAKSGGMTKKEIFVLIELPLAAPVILAGIRTSIVINIGTATIGAVAGAGGLGAPIISGLVQMNPAIVLQGAIPTALLALAIDGILSLLQEAITPAHNKYIR